MPEIGKHITNVKFMQNCTLSMFFWKKKWKLIHKIYSPYSFVLLNIAPRNYKDVSVYLGSWCLHHQCDQMNMYEAPWVALSCIPVVLLQFPHRSADPGRLGLNPSGILHGGLGHLWNKHLKECTQYCSHQVSVIIPIVENYVWTDTHPLWRSLQAGYMLQLHPVYQSHHCRQCPRHYWYRSPVCHSWYLLLYLHPHPWVSVLHQCS